MRCNALLLYVTLLEALFLSSAGKADHTQSLLIISVPQPLQPLFVIFGKG